MPSPEYEVSSVTSNYELVNSALAAFTPEVIAPRSATHTAAAPTTRTTSIKAYSTVVIPSSSRHKARMVSSFPFLSRMVVRQLLGNLRAYVQGRHLNKKGPASPIAAILTHATR